MVEYNQTGNYTVLISFLVGILNQYAPFLGVTVQGVVQVISAGAVLWGVYKSYKAHKNAAVSAVAAGIAVKGL